MMSLKFSTKIPQINKKIVSAIVPVYCEEKTLRGVVNVLLNSPLINEVVCVDDASEDNSLKILENFGDKIKLICHKENKGKGAALVSGIRKSTGDILLFMDADIFNLSNNHLDTMLNPILTENYRAVVGYPPVKFKFFKDWSGERVYYKKDLIPHLKNIAQTRFGVEMYLNFYFKDRTKNVFLKDLEGPYKNYKFTPEKAIQEYIKCGLEVVRVKSELWKTNINDFDHFKSLLNSKSIDEFTFKVKSLKSKKIRLFLEKYVLDRIREVKINK